MNEAKWDDLAARFDRGELIPANGMTAWKDQAMEEAVLIRRLLPDTVVTLLEVGCGVGRLTPHLGLLFKHVIATDTSVFCRTVTSRACAERRNVEVRQPGDHAADAALVWGNLYDGDWTRQAAQEHMEHLMSLVPLVLVQNPPPLRVPIKSVMTGGTGQDWMLIEGWPA